MRAALVGCFIVAAAGAATALAAAVPRWYGVSGSTLLAVAGLGATEGLGDDRDIAPGGAPIATSQQCSRDSASGELRIGRENRPLIARRGAPVRPPLRTLTARVSTGRPPAAITVPPERRPHAAN